MTSLLQTERFVCAPEAPSLAQRVYSRVFQAIVTGEIPGGTKLVAALLAKQLGISITPVREALLRLATEGLVQAIPRVGYIVEAMSEADVLDVFDARTGIECWIAKLAADRVTPADIAYIEDNLRQTTQALERDGTEQLIALDTAFHQFIAQVAGNKTLLSVSQLLIQRMYRFRLACFRSREIAETTRNGHVEIVRALRRKDSREVEQAMMDHLGEVKRQVCLYLAQPLYPARESLKVSS